MSGVSLLAARELRDGKRPRAAGLVVALERGDRARVGRELELVDALADLPARPALRRSDVEVAQKLRPLPLDAGLILLWLKSAFAPKTSQIAFFC